MFKCYFLSSQTILRMFDALLNWYWYLVFLAVTPGEVKRVFGLIIHNTYDSSMYVYEALQTRSTIVTELSRYCI